MNVILDTLKNPDVLEAAAILAALAPPPEGLMLAAALRLVEQWIRAGKTIDEVNAIVDRYSLEAQGVADAWAKP